MRLWVPCHNIYQGPQHIKQCQAKMSRCGPERQAATAMLSLLQVLANPSTSDVVATTSCEALAMGKWVPCFRKCIVALPPACPQHAVWGSAGGLSAPNTLPTNSFPLLPIV